MRRNCLFSTKTGENRAKNAQNEGVVFTNSIRGQFCILLITRWFQHLLHQKWCGIWWEGRGGTGKTVVSDQFSENRSVGGTANSFPFQLCANWPNLYANQETVEQGTGRSPPTAVEVNWGVPARP
jgi:hypothetical protein